MYNEFRYVISPEKEYVLTIKGTNQQLKFNNLALLLLTSNDLLAAFCDGDGFYIT